MNRYDNSACELDAMDPNELRNSVRQEVEGYIKPDEWERHKTIEALRRETTKEIAQADR